ncbi:MAG: cache domain-containing protein [Deltaproteobacteria bacterium]|nr:cache domain-containing protein [Deltaproteobacteria bacterium]MBW2594664.1 cache domain-containing protein [Deltaproteobacteria bacterium]MBW2649757.1 cache domain-containing protein [Deltaproteobacteria bacterium]
MAEMTTGKQFFTVARVFFLLIVIPLLLVSFLIANGIFQLGDTSKKRAAAVLDQKAQEEIKARTVAVAENVAGFLQECERDTLVATILPADAETYKEFVLKNRQTLWMKKDGKIVKSSEPMYVEMALVDKAGNEVIKIVDGEVAPESRLANISDLVNTIYKSEDYFVRTKNLDKGSVYVSHVTGWYVNRADFEKGKRFEGIIRFATPLYDKQGFAGLVTLALDVRHLAKFTDNIIPTQPGYVLEADSSTGNYAYMVDDRGFVISHPDDYHIAGFYQDGTPVSYLTGETLDNMTKKGEEVLNLLFMGYMDPALPEIAKDAAAGHSGDKIYKFGSHTKFVAYAPILFYSANYPKPAGFGWIGMGLDVDKFNEMALATTQKIEKEAQAWLTTIILILVVAVIILFLITTLLSRGITRSIESEVPEGAEPHYYDDEDGD